MQPAFVLVERDRDDQWSCSSKNLDQGGGGGEGVSEEICGTVRLPI